MQGHLNLGYRPTAEQARRLDEVRAKLVQSQLSTVTAAAQDYAATQLPVQRSQALTAQRAFLAVALKQLEEAVLVADAAQAEAALRKALEAAAQLKGTHLASHRPPAIAA